MTTLSHDSVPSGAAPDPRPRGGETATRTLCGLTAVGLLVPFALCSLTGDTGARISAGLVDDAVLLQVGSGIAVLVAAGLMVAGGRLAAHVAATAPSRLAGRLVQGAALAVAVLFAAYYAVFGGGAVIAAEVDGGPGPGLGESTWVLLNVVELTRYAPGLVLVAAAAALRDRLPRGVWGTAAVLAVMTVFPLTSWVAALLIPLWLAVVGAVLPGRPS